MLPFLQSELCALEDLRVVDPHTCHARFVSEAGCKCARHQSQHMLFTPESKLLAFEVLTGQRYRAAARKDPDRSAGAAESARDLYVRWATATPPGEESSRLATLRDYLGAYSQAAHLHAAVPRGVPEYGFLSFSSGVARDAVLALEELVIDGKPVLVRPIHTKPEKQRRPDWPGGAQTEPVKPRKSWPPAYDFAGGPPPAPPPATYGAYYGDGAYYGPPQPYGGAAPPYGAPLPAYAYARPPYVYVDPRAYPPPVPYASPPPSPRGAVAAALAPPAEATDPAARAAIASHLDGLGAILQRERDRQGVSRAAALAAMADKIDELRRDVGGGEEPVDVDALVASLKEALSAPASPTSPASPPSPAAPAPPDAAAAQLVDVSVDGADAGAN